MTALVQPIAPLSSLVEAPDPRGLGGLVALAEGRERALPLASVKVRAAIAGNVARTVVEQRFRNDLDVGMEAVHIFPLPEDGAVTEVELRCGEIVVRAECRERKEAEQVFDEARQAGHRAALLTQERADVHTLRVTNLPPGQEVVVRIVIVEKLAATDGRFRWRFPTVIPPRYLPGNAVGHAGPGVLPDTDAAPDASRLQPPMRLAGGTPLDLEVSLTGPLAMLASSLHAVRMDLGDGTVRVAPSERSTLNKDFVLAFSTGEAQATSARAWTDGAHTLVVVEPPTAAVAPAMPRDAVFVVDISGSMSGIKIDAARQALSAALHGLLPGDRFALVAFDDRIERFKPDFVAYDDRSLAAADAWIARLQPRGGTEMLPAIQAALAGATPAGRLRTVLFITDGQAWNEDQLVAAVGTGRAGARFFTMGIDTAVNGSLLERLARVGGGTCELVTPRDDIESAVSRLEARFGSPVALDVRVDGAVAATEAPAVVFQGAPASLLVEGAPEVLRVRGSTAQGALDVEVRPTRIDFPLGALFARERIATLEDRMVLDPRLEEDFRPRILELALQHGIASRYTAFVAVERSSRFEGERVEVVQAAELPEAWDASFATGAMPPPAMSAPMPSRAPVGMARPSAPMMMPSAAPRPVAEASRKKLARPTEASAPGGGVLRSLGKAVADFFGGAGAPPQEPEAPYDAPEAQEEADLYAPGAPSAGDAAARPARAESAPGGDPAATLAKSQSADGSFGGDVARTAAALVALVVLGHTRRSGARSRTVLKAAAWLAGRADPLAVLALAVLDEAERGGAPARTPAWEPLLAAGPEGAVLARVA